MPIDKKKLEECVDVALKKIIDTDVELVRFREYLGLSAEGKRASGDSRAAQKLQDIVAAVRWDYRQTTKQFTIDQRALGDAIVNELKETIDSYKTQLLERKDYTFEELHPGVADFSDAIVNYSVTDAVKAAITQYRAETESKRATGVINTITAVVTWRADDDLRLIKLLEATQSANTKNPTVCDQSLADTIQKRKTEPGKLSHFERCLFAQGLIAKDGSASRLLTSVSGAAPATTAPAANAKR